MKILTVVYSLGKGGTQRAAQNFAEGYALNGHDSKVLATEVGGIREAELVERGIPVWLHPSSDVLDAIQKWRPDVIHLHSHGLKIAEVEAIVAQAPTAKIVETNDFSVPSPWINRLDNSFQLSNWSEWLYQRRTGGSGISSVVPYPVRTDDFFKASEEVILTFRAQHGLNSDHIILGRIGQSFNGKWSPLLTDVFENICGQDQRFRLLVVNPPKSIVDRIKESRFKERVVLIDQIIGDENLRAVYSTIDIFVLIADQGESFGMVLAESLLCETPVVAYSTPWGDNSQCEVVGHMEGGLVVTTPKGLERAILHLANDKQLRKTLGESGRKRIIDLYDYRKIADNALDNISPRVDSNHTNGGGQSMVTIYTNSFDNPPAIAKSILRLGKYLVLIRYITGYQPWSVLTRRISEKLFNYARRHLRRGAR